MYLDTKLPQFKSFLSENKLNNGGVKTTIDQSAVSAGENANVDLNLNSETGSEADKKSKKKKKDELEILLKKQKSEEKISAKSETEIKSINMKLLNLL